MTITQINPRSRIDIANNVKIGNNVVFGMSCKEIKIGFGSIIGRDVYIDVEYLDIGEYTTIHHGSVIHGMKTRIGHNCWFGHYSIIDSVGGETIIGNGVGAGAHSQLWSHMKFGDVLAGCRWHSSGRLQLDDDVWLVGHSITGPIHAERRSMLMTGSVAVKNMKENRIYSGSPAFDITDRIGGQFEEPDAIARARMFEQLKAEFAQAAQRSVDQFIAVDAFDDRNGDMTQFNLATREYTPRYTADEYDFMRFLLYDKAKFIPIS